MALTASGAFDTTINGLSMRVGGALTIVLPGAVGSLDLTANLSSIELDQTMTTDVPDGVRTEAGYSNTGGTCTLAGTIASLGMTVADLFNPDNSASPLYRLKIKQAPVTFDFGVVPMATPPQLQSAPELLRKFTGIVSSIASIDHSNGTVTLNLVDMTGTWTTLPDIPAVVTAPPYNAGLTSEAVIDAIARQLPTPLYTWPALRANCILAAGLRTSLWPEVGTLDGAVFTQPTPTFAPGVFGSGLASVDDQDNIQYLLTSAVGRSAFFEFWFTLSGDGGVQVYLTSGLLSVNNIGVVVSNGIITVGSGAGGGVKNFTGLTTTGAHYLAVEFALPAVGGTTYSATLYLDGTSMSTGSLTFSARTSDPFDLCWVFPSDSSGSATIEGLQVTTETSPVTNEAFVPTAFLEPSLNVLQTVPEIPAGSAVLDILQEIAAAESGYIRLDEQGNLRFSNRNTINAYNITRTLDSRVSLKAGLTTALGAFTESDHVQVDFTPWQFGPAGLVFNTTAVWLIKAGTTLTLSRDLTDAVIAAEVDGSASLLPNGHTTTDGNSWYRASRDVNGLNAHGAITVQISQTAPSSVQITIKNTSSFPAYMCSPTADVNGNPYTDMAAGSPSLWIGGLPVTAANTTILDITYGAGSNVYTFPTNSYRQDQESATALGQFTLEDLFHARPDYQGIDIVPDARVQVPDMVMINDPDVSKIVEPVLIWGWHFSADFTSAAWDMTLDARAVSSPGGWLLGIAGRSELGSTTYA